MGEVEEVVSTPVDEKCTDCNENIATGMYLNICMNMQEKDDVSIECEVLFDDMVRGDITREDLLLAIRDKADPETIGLLDTVDALERGDELKDMGPEDNVEV